MQPNTAAPRLTFCNAATLETPAVSTPRPQWTSNNWDTSFDILVFIHSPGTGNPTNSPCGMTYSGGIVGQVTHT